VEIEKRLVHKIKNIETSESGGRGGRYFSLEGGQVSMVSEEGGKKPETKSRRGVKNECLTCGGRKNTYLWRTGFKKDNGEVSWGPYLLWGGVPKEAAWLMAPKRSAGSTKE